MGLMDDPREQLMVLMNLPDDHPEGEAFAMPVVEIVARTKDGREWPLPFAGNPSPDTPDDFIGLMVKTMHALHHVSSWNFEIDQTNRATPRLVHSQPLPGLPGGKELS